MKRFIAPIIIAALIFLGVDVSDALLTSDVVLTNDTGSAITESAVAFPLSTQGLLNSNSIDTDTLNMALVDTSDDQVPMMPSPLQTELESCKLDDGGVFTTDTTDCNDAGADDVALLPATPLNNDAFYFGGHWPFRILRLNIGTAHSATGTPMIIAWEYCTDGTCTTTSAVSNLVDDTDAFRNSGTQTVSFDMPEDWTEATVDGVAAYWLRARVTQNPSGTIVQPLGTQSWWDRGIAEVMMCDVCDPTVTTLSDLSLANNSSTSYQMFLGQTDDVDEHQYFPGTDGFTVADNASLEASAGNTMEFIINDFYGVADGTQRHLVQKGAGIYVRWTATNTIEAFFDMATDNCVLESGVLTSGLFTSLRVEADPGAGNCFLAINGSVVDTDTDTGDIADNASNWEFVKESSVVFVGRIDLNVNGSSSEAIWVLDDDPYPLTGTALSNILNPGTFDGTPTFNVPTTNIGTISSFEAVQIVEGDPVGSPDILGDVDAPEIAGTPISGTTLPGGDAVAALATAGELPSSIFWLMLGFVASVATLAVGFRFTQNVVFSMLLAGFVMTMFSLLGFFELWQVMVFAVVGAVIVLIGARFTISA